jgi:hypothetical protein
MDVQNEQSAKEQDAWLRIIISDTRRGHRCCQSEYYTYQIFFFWSSGIEPECLGCTINRDVGGLSGGRDGQLSEQNKLATYSYV